ncbi:sugar ABC transporter permease [Leeia sp. TBRC 13508]|uniref:Sugar ABC transporter permease n=1 Tax=Leeia speluncae TaxID=2884804 RepID=A0ABS8D8A5_9NEIS|nr:sugar ABC transporter permease [Leeia speluncae]MCB6184432.1 sugar ABC transporter permease [Leeia speluncae]
MREVLKANQSVNQQATLKRAKSKRVFSNNFFAALTVSPSILVLLVAVYVFIGWSVLISFTGSQYFPVYEFVGFEQYVKLWASERWMVSVNNLFTFSIFFVVVTMALGLLMAILLDQKIRAEGAIRMIFLYPMAVSLIVTGVAWKWILNPDTGLDRLFNSIGLNIHVDWLVNPEMSIYAVIVAAIWQTAGFVMAIFLAGLRSVDNEIIKAARMEGAGYTRIYLEIILPVLRPAFFTVIIILVYQAIRSFDLVIALTNGGPGYSSDLPTTFMYKMTFSRGELAQGEASAVMILLTVIAIIVPYLYSEMRNERRNSK